MHHLCPDLYTSLKRCTNQEQSNRLWGVGSRLHSGPFPRSWQATSKKHSSSSFDIGFAHLACTLAGSGLRQISQHLYQQCWSLHDSYHTSRHARSVAQTLELLYEHFTEHHDYSAGKINVWTEGRPDRPDRHSAAYFPSSYGNPSISGIKQRL